MNIQHLTNEELKELKTITPFQTTLGAFSGMINNQYLKQQEKYKHTPEEDIIFLLIKRNLKTRILLKKIAEENA